MADAHPSGKRGAAGYNPCMSEPSNNAILDRLLDPLITREFAEKLGAFRPDPQTLARLEQLRDRANDGVLTGPERDEYEQYVESLDLVAVLQAKARSVLSRRAS